MSKAKKPKAKDNLAKDVETPPPPKMKRIDLPETARVEVARMTQNLDTYIAGIVAGMGIKGKWAYDVRKMQILVEKKD